MSDNIRSRSRSPKQSRIHTKRVVFDNLPFGTSFQKLKDIIKEELGFSGFLEMITAQNGKDMGMGVMEFKTFEGAQKAIEKINGIDFGGRKLNVHEEAERDKSRVAKFYMDNGGNGDVRASNNSGNNSRNNQNSRGGGGDIQFDRGAGGLPALFGGSNNSSRYMDSSISSTILQQLGLDTTLPRQIYVANLDPKVTRAKLHEVFVLAGNVLDIEVASMNDGRGRLHALLRYELPSEALQAIAMFDNQYLYDSPMKVELDREKPPEPVGTRLPEGLRGIGTGFIPGMVNTSSNIRSNVDLGLGFGVNNMVGGRSDNNMYNNAPSNNGSGRSNNSGSRSVMVCNIPFSYTWKDLRRIFQNCGDIQVADVIMDTNGKSKGVGKVRFTRAEDAQRAASSMNGVRCDGRAIRVELD